MNSSTVDEIKSKLDIVDVIKDYIKLEKAGINYRARCPFHAEKSPSFFVSPSRQIWHCFGGCFPKETLISTKKGLKNIEDIKVGDEALTHMARFRPVLKTYTRSHDEDLIDIKVRKSNRVVSLTKDHKVFAIKTVNCKQKSRETRLCQKRCKQNCPTKYFEDYKVEQIKAEDLNLNDFLLFPINKEEKDIKLNFSDIYEIDGVSYAVFPIKEISKRKYKGKVYDLTVEEDHSFTTENFTVSNCGIGGDMFKFVMEIEGVEFPEALRILANKAGVEIKKINPQVVSEKHKLLKICEIATLFFQAQMKSVVGGEVKEYLKERGINDESIEKWKIGYAPNAWSNLSDFLISKGYTKRDIVKVGLASEKDEKIFDRFRSRIIFPIFDLQNQVIGFGGRTFKVEDPAKYLNSPATVLYDKSKVLYGLNNAKIDLRKKDACILVEGYTDVILSHQSGITNTIATSGTALTPDQLDILKRYTNNLITAFDMDSAGNSATTRGINLAQSKGFNIRVVSMIPGKDPADVVKENPEEWKKLIENNKSITEFYFDVAFGEEEGVLSPEKKRKISDDLLPIIKRIDNRIEQVHWIQELSSRLGVKEEHIEEELKKFKIEKVEVEKEKEVKHVHKTRLEQLEERLLSLLIKYPEKVNLIEESFLNFVTQRSKEFLKELKDKGKIEEGNDFINTLYLKAEIEDLNIKLVEEEIKVCLKEIKSLNIKNLLEKKREEMKVAEYNKDEEKIEQLSKEIHQLTKDGQ
jgi:DNA primase